MSSRPDVGPDSHRGAGRARGGRWPGSTDPGARSTHRPTLSRRQLSSALWRWRFLVAALAAGAAVALVVGQLRPAPAPTVPVVVSARELAAGTVLEPADLRLARAAPGTVPESTPSQVSAVAGHTVVVAIPAGMPMVDALVHPDGLASTAPPGTVVAPVRLADGAVAAMLRPGDLVDVLAAGGSGSGAPTRARLVARRALVLDAGAWTTQGSSGGLLDLGAGGSAGQITVLAVQPDEAADLAGALGWGSLTAVLVQ